MAGILERVKSIFTGAKPTGDAADLQKRLTRTEYENHMLRARIDAAQTSPENQNHWSGADSFAADWAYNHATRFTLRNRARHEAVNNCYAKGAVRSAADDMIGTGPRLQLSLPTAPGAEPDDATAKLIEDEFRAWMDETHFAMNLRIAHKSYIRDGECFGVFDSDTNLQHPVKFDVRWLESEQCGTPYDAPIDPFLIDGIRFDKMGKPVEYFFYLQHPGSLTITGLPIATERVPAKNVVHWYCADRFGQHRGIPALTPALPIYAQTRRLTLATLTAAEFAACLAGVLKTNLPPSSTAPATVDAWTMFELVRGALMALPEGYEASQFKSENPPAQYGEFKRELLNETGRATNQPLNVITGNSSGYNFSSGRLDHLPYQRGIRIDRNELRLIVLDPIFREFIRELIAAEIIPNTLPPIRQWRWCWNWDGFDSIDQSKDAMADDVRLKNGTATYSEILAEYGQDWQDLFAQIAREKAEAQKLGLSYPVLSAPPTSADVSAAAQNPNRAVAMALEEAGIAEDVAKEIMDALEPTFAQMRQARAKPSRNGHHRSMTGGKL